MSDRCADLLSLVGGVGNSANVAVRMENVVKTYGSLHVLRGIDLTVHRGQCVCIVGPSGSGKTTLIRCINALETIASGTIFVNGHPLGMIARRGKFSPANERDLARQRQEIGMVFQRFNLFPHLTALENVLVGPMRVRNMPRQQAEPLARGLISRVGLGEKMDAYPRQLSGGQQQRIAICRALAMRPALMLFDEPTSALDPEMIGEVLEVIAELKREGMTMVIVTHEMKFARHTADRVIMMDDGLVVEDQPPDLFFDSPTDERTRRFLSRVL